MLNIKYDLLNNTTIKMFYEFCITKYKNTNSKITEETC